MYNNYRGMVPNGFQNMSQVPQLTSAQERLAMMDSYNNQNMQMQQSGVIQGRQVASIREVDAMGISFDGSIFVFPDYANNRIYTKQIALNGKAVIKEYGEIVPNSLEQIQMQQQQIQQTNIQQATNNQGQINPLATEIETLKMSIQEIKETLSSLATINNTRKGVSKNVQSNAKQSNADDANDAESKPSS